MSRSRKKTPIFPIGSDKMKWWKKMANQKLRHVPVDGELPHKNMNNIWGNPSDGKSYRRNTEEKDMRK